MRESQESRYQLSDHLPRSKIFTVTPQQTLNWTPGYRFQGSLHQLDHCGCVIPRCASTIYYSRTHMSHQGGNTCFPLQRRFCSAIGAICCRYVNSSKSAPCPSRITMAKRTSVSVRFQAAARDYLSRITLHYGMYDSTTIIV